jgi:hypothetical protein
MSIVIRCAGCHKFYAVKNKHCACGAENKSPRQYYVRYNGRTTYAGDSLPIAKEIEVKCGVISVLGGLMNIASQHYYARGESRTNR